MIKFEKITNYKNAQIPKRATEKSAGYDFHAYGDHTIEPGKQILIPTGIKAKFDEDIVLKLYIRSSLAFKKELVLSNACGIIDADYYNNIDNEGHIQFLVRNNSESTIYIKNEERIGQGIFQKYYKTDDDQVDTKRKSGFGSTGK